MVAKKSIVKIVSVAALAHTLSLPASAQHLSTYQNKTVAPISVNGLRSSFPASYEDSRARFVGYASQFEKKNISVQSLSAEIPMLQKAPLHIDGLFVEGKDPRKLMILTSGIHGAEAFTGATLQDFLMQHLLREGRPKISLLVVHALNPFGFKHLRRANPSNVDLNRNHADRAEFTSTNEAFATLKPTLSPDATASVGILPQTGFYISLLLRYLTSGKKIVLNSLSGQYQYPESIFYGGRTAEKETLVVQGWISQFIKDKTHVLHIDLHTGFGEKGKLHFYGSDEYTSPEQIRNVQLVFPDAKIDSGRDSDFYVTKGDFSDWTWKTHPQIMVIPMVFEFGTLDSQTVSGGLKSLWTMVLENQGYHHSYGTDHDRRQIRRRFEALFNPQDSGWQKKIAEQGVQQLTNAYDRFSAIQ